METLRISPKYTATHWKNLVETRAADWPEAVKIVKDRLEGRFLDFADKCLQEDYSGFVVLAIDCLLVETIQQFIEGETDGRKKSKRCFTRFLKRQQFLSEFTNRKTREGFYRDIRCGLLHQAEAKNKWLVRRQQPKMLQKVVTPQYTGYIIDVVLFHQAIKDSLAAYLAELLQPNEFQLRANLWTKMNAICNERTNRGAMELAEPGAASLTA